VTEDLLMKRSRYLTFLGASFLAVGAMSSLTAGRPASSTLGAVFAAHPMLEPRSGHSATLLSDGRVLIAGGMRRNQDFYRSAEVYDPVTNTFRVTGDLNTRRVGHAAVLLRSGKVLIAGGWIGRGCTDSAELYDPATGKFTPIAKMNSCRGRPSVTLLDDGDVLIGGGGDSGGPDGIAAAELFHETSLSFERIPSMHYARIAHTATLLGDGRVLIAGGRGDTVTATAELYDPRRKQFVTTGSLITARYKHTAGLLLDGKVLVAGGSDDHDWHGTMSSAEIYDPHTGKFAATSHLNESRFKLPDDAVLLASGQMLIAGGSREVELYDPPSGKFLVVPGQLSDSWHFMTETLLKDGRVLLAGGYPDSDQATSQTWIYRR